MRNPAERLPQVLVTAGRFAPATGMVRALHRAGARVDVVDSYQLAPALHAHAVDEIHLAAPPAREPVRFAEDVAAIVRRRDIDLVVPSFEEGFYLAHYSDLVPAPIFTAPFATLSRLHDKARFVALCRDLGLRTPKTRLARSRDELRRAAAEHVYFVARPVFSRGGMSYLTNHGPRASETTIDACNPSAENPWLVQDYVDGRDACSFSVAREGRILVHCPYEPSIAAPGGWSVRFTSIDDFGSLEIAATICAELGFTGFIGFDYRRTEDGVVMLECNPRSSAGIFLCPEQPVGKAVLGALSEPSLVAPGRSRQFDAFLLDPYFMHWPPHKVVHALLTAPDAMMSGLDVLPSLFALISRRHWSHVAKREHRSVSQAAIADISWDGSPMPAGPAHPDRSGPPPDPLGPS